ncbi:class I SAM-dependent methyltransferase [Oceanidesulfovibrio marinus]|uniref:Methyltransferase domain-containing protein n=1 Tax=Oceanidesulfovibrio marinus TaxID=370038 RepID=A0A6P1ZCK2_9BACT|nr:class I SAM-dependent methyltransferase [Oceanidesulfovibrio marinus]TVM31231.1 hypothetical protein DQK91_19165 [Oceanidesulfovibrio marinus]
MTSCKDFDALLKPGVTLGEAEPGILTALDPDKAANSYDAQGALAFYDSVACNPLYNRLVWGYRVSGLHAFCSELLASDTDGWFLDAGCGSLAFTARAYQESDRPVVLADQSLTLLRKAKERLERGSTGNSNIVFLQADVMDLPFRDSSFSTVMSMNMLHVLPKAETMIGEVMRVAAPGGSIGFTTLHRAGRWSDGYMRMWENKEELVCRDESQLQAMFTQHDLNATIHTHGNMAFINVA